MLRDAARTSRDVDEINLVMSASDTHGMANLRMMPEQSLVQFREIIEDEARSLGAVGDDVVA